MEKMRIYKVLTKTFAVLVFVSISDARNDEIQKDYVDKQSVRALCKIEELHMKTKLRKEIAKSINGVPDDILNKERLAWTIKEQYNLKCSPQLDNKTQNNNSLLAISIRRDLFTKNLVVELRHDQNTCDYSVMTVLTRVPFIEYHTHSNSAHTITAAATDIANSSDFTLVINHVNNRDTSQKLSIDFDMMPLPMRLVAQFNSKSAIPTHVLFTQKRIPPSQQAEVKQLRLNSKSSDSQTNITEKTLPDLLKTIKAHIGVDSILCDKLECNMIDAGDKLCQCSKRVVNSDIQLEANSQLRQWWYPTNRQFQFSYKCVFNCLYHDPNYLSSLQDQLDFYTTWSGYFKQIWSKPYMYTGYIFAMYFLALLIQQLLNVVFESAFVRGLSFVLMMAVFIVTMTMIVPVSLCSQIISFQYTMHLVQGAHTSLIAFRLSQAVSFVIILLYPTILVTIMIIPVFFYAADILNYEKFHLVYFKLPIPETDDEEEDNVEDKPPLYDQLMPLIVDKTDLTDNPESKIDLNHAKCTTSDDSEEDSLMSSDPFRQLMSGSLLLFNCVNLGFICILVYLMWF